MPAGEESLSDLLLHSDKQDLDGNELLKAIKSVSNSSKDMCKKYLYSWEKSQELLETARYINFNFEKLYNELND